MIPFPNAADLRGQLVILGCGTSVGVPVIGCGCAICQSNDSRDKRTRSSVALGLPDGLLLIDTSPDLRFQLLRERIPLVHAVLYTHEHADHVFGLDDLRLFPFYLGHPVPVYCEKIVEDRLRKSFDYAFGEGAGTHPGATPQLEVRRVGLEPFRVLGAKVVPIRLKHGPRFEVLGFRFGDVAYCTDVKEIPTESLPLLEGLDTLILDALRPRPHPTHFSLDEAIAAVEILKPRRTLFTHLSHELGYVQTNAKLREMTPAGMELAYDGQRVRLT